MAKKKKKGKPMIYKTLHKKLNIEQTNPTKNRKWCDPEEKAVSAPYVHPPCYSYYNDDKS